MSATMMLAPPWRRPLREPMPAAMDEYVSVREELVTRTVKVELLPPPCSACVISNRSSIRASRGVKSPFSR